MTGKRERSYYKQAEKPTQELFETLPETVEDYAPTGQVIFSQEKC